MTLLRPELQQVTEYLLARGHRITSTVRSKADNERVGGSKASRHLTGGAFDVVPRDGYRELVRDVIHALETYFPRGRLLLEPDHIHVDDHPVPGISVEVPNYALGDRYVRIYGS